MNNNSVVKAGKKTPDSNPRRSTAGEKQHQSGGSVDKNARKSGGGKKESMLRSPLKRSRGRENLLTLLEKAEREAAHKKERETYVLWERPIGTLHYAFLEFAQKVMNGYRRLRENLLCLSLFANVMLMYICYSLCDVPYKETLQWFNKEALRCIYWFCLGFMTSTGLGPQLHMRTFLFYLGPHIASVTLAAYECGALNFPEPPYPEEILCPLIPDPLWETSLWNIICKVWVVALSWGVGTAVGELPTYFISRNVRLFDKNPNDRKDVKELKKLKKKIKDHPETLTFVDRLKMKVENVLASTGFFGILVFASVPNPFFGLVGAISGHFLVPFWKFAGATFLGKSVIKVTLQITSIVFALNENLVGQILEMLSKIPVVGDHLEESVLHLFVKQLAKYHGDEIEDTMEEIIVRQILTTLGIIMMLFYAVTTVNLQAQTYLKKLQKDRYY